jgi:CHRD domain-containing protein
LISSRKPRVEFGYWEREDNVHKQMKYAGLITVILGLAAGPYAVAEEGSRGARRVRADLDGYQETPSTLSTTGRGTFEAKIDDDAMTIEYELSYADLESTATAAHIHLGRPATTGGVSAFLCGGGTKPLCPPAGGTVSGVIVPSDVIGPTSQGIAPGEFEELVRAMRSGATYTNVHSTSRPSGEIRGVIRDRRQRDDD